MRNVVRWEPARDVWSLRDAMDKLFEESVVSPRSWLAPMGGMDLAVDMYETDTDLVISTALPGVQAEDMDVTITGDLLCIKAEIKAETKDENASYYRQERRYGSLRSQRHTAGACPGRQGTGPVQGRRPDPDAAQGGRGHAQGHQGQGRVQVAEPAPGSHEIKRQASLWIKRDLPLCRCPQSQAPAACRSGGASVTASSRRPSPRLTASPTGASVSPRYIPQTSLVRPPAGPSAGERRAAPRRPARAT